MRTDSTELSVAEVLRRAKAEIPVPEKWCQDALARDEKGNRKPANSPDAIQHCATGAILAVLDAPNWASATLRTGVEALRFLDGAASEHGFPYAADLNNNSDHPTVMWMFDRAIELALSNGDSAPSTAQGPVNVSEPQVGA